MKELITTRSNGTKRLSYDFSDEKVITDQAPAKELTMSAIVKKLEKGIMPNLRDGLIYSTDLGVRNLQEVRERQKQTEDLFYQLPLEIRNLMGQNIDNFEQVVTDPKNAEILLQHGILQQKRDNHTELINAISGLREDLPKAEPETPPKASKKA